MRLGVHAKMGGQDMTVVRPMDKGLWLGSLAPMCGRLDARATVLGMRIGSISTLVLEESVEHAEARHCVPRAEAGRRG
jgi:hypothetical protein